MWGNKLIQLGESTVVQSFWETIVPIFLDPACATDLLTQIIKDTCIGMFIATFCVILVKINKETVNDYP